MVLLSKFFTSIFIFKHFFVQFVRQKSFFSAETTGGIASTQRSLGKYLKSGALEVRWSCKKCLIVMFSVKHFV